MVHGSAKLVLPMSPALRIMAAAHALPELHGLPALHIFAVLHVKPVITMRAVSAYIECRTAHSRQDR